MKTQKQTNATYIPLFQSNANISQIANISRLRNSSVKRYTFQFKTTVSGNGDSRQKKLPWCYLIYQTTWSNTWKTIKSFYVLLTQYHLRVAMYIISKHHFSAQFFLLDFFWRFICFRGYSKFLSGSDERQPVVYCLKSTLSMTSSPYFPRPGFLWYVLTVLST